VAAEVARLRDELRREREARLASEETAQRILDEQQRHNVLLEQRLKNAQQTPRAGGTPTLRQTPRWTAGRDGAGAAASPQMPGAGDEAVGSAAAGIAVEGASDKLADADGAADSEPEKKKKKKKKKSTEEPSAPVIAVASPGLHLEEETVADDAVAQLRAIEDELNAVVASLDAE